MFPAMFISSRRRHTSTFCILSFVPRSLCLVSVCVWIAVFSFLWLLVLANSPPRQGLRFRRCPYLPTSLLLYLLYISEQFFVADWLSVVVHYLACSMFGENGSQRSSRGHFLLHTKQSVNQLFHSYSWKNEKYNAQ